MNLREKIQKLFPPDKTLTVEKLKKEHRNCMALQLIWASVSLFAVPLIIAGAKLPDEWQRLSIVSAGGLFALLCLYMSNMFSGFDSEIKFEMRIREALVDAKNSKNQI